MVLQDGYCKKCQRQYTNIYNKWCKLCQIDNFKINFTNWTSGHEKIDDLIQEVQLEIDEWDDIIFEWIPYRQFKNIKEINKSDVYLAIWKCGMLHYNKNTEKYERDTEQKVILKYLYHSQNTIDEFLNEVTENIFY